MKNFTSLLTLLLLTFHFSYGQKWSELYPDIQGPKDFINYGQEVAISGDGYVMAFSTNSTPTNNVGVEVFVDNITNEWEKRASTLTTPENELSYGNAIAINEHGTTIVVGANEYSDQGAIAGRIFIYEYGNKQYTLVDDDIVGEEGWFLGTDIDISDDGSVIAISAPGYQQTPGSPAVGAVLIYQRSISGYVHVNTIVNTYNGSTFGYCLDLNGNGDKLIVGDPDGVVVLPFDGRATIYEKIGDNWQERATLVPQFGNQENFASDVAINDDGSVVAVGIRNHPFNFWADGTVRVFEYKNNIYQQLYNDLAPVLGHDNFGRRLSLSKDGKQVTVGGSNAIKSFVNDGNDFVYMGGIVGGENTALGSVFAVNNYGDRMIVSESTRSYGSFNNNGCVKSYNFQLPTNVEILSTVTTGTSATVQVRLSGYIPGKEISSNYIQESNYDVAVLEGFVYNQDGTIDATINYEDLKPGVKCIYDVTWELPNGTYYSATNFTFTPTDPKWPQEIENAQQVVATYGDEPLSLTWSASSGLPLTYSVDDVNIATITDGKLQIFSAGTTKLRASQPGNDQYFAAEEVAMDLIVKKRPLNLVSDPLSKVYDGTTEIDLVNVLLEGVLSDDEVNIENAEKGHFVSKNVSEVLMINTNITLNGEDASNYLLSGTNFYGSIVPRKLQIANLTVYDKAYDGTKAAAINDDYSLINAIEGDEITLTNLVFKFIDKHVGDNKNLTIDNYFLSGNDVMNYDIEIPAKKANIIAKDIQIKGLAVKSKVYDGTVKAILNEGYELNGVIEGDDVSINEIEYEYLTPGYGIGKTVFASLASLKGEDAFNYNLQTDYLDGDITKAVLNVTVLDAQRNVGEYNPVFQIQYEGFIPGENKSHLDVEPTVTTEATKDSPAGEYPLVVSGGEDWNYDFNYTNGTITIGTSTDIKHSAFEGVMIYPNPVKNQLFITGLKDKRPSIVLLDITGRTVLSTNETVIDFSQFEDGIYILQLKVDNKILTRKIMKRN